MRMLYANVTVSRQLGKASFGGFAYVLFINKSNWFNEMEEREKAIE